MPKDVSYNQFVQVQQNSIRSLNEISKAKNLPSDLKDAVDLVTKLFENYDVEQFREPLRKITGEHFGAQLQTDNVGYSSEKVLNNNSLESYLAGQF